MRPKRRITRDTIVETLVKALEPLDFVHAFWEGGAVAFSRVDDWSDIDLYVLVDNDRVPETFLAFEEALKSLSPLKRKYDVPQTGWQDVYQAFYKLENSSEYLLIDLAVLKASSPEKFIEPKIHGEVKFHFNKNGEVKPIEFDKDSFIKRLQGRLSRLRARLDMFNVFVQKEINRGNYLEALDLYYSLTLSTLVEALRIKHNPLHYDFKMRYIHYELPSRVVKRLERLYFVSDGKELQDKYRQANRWLLKTIQEINPEQTKKTLKEALS